MAEQSQALYLRHIRRSDWRHFTLYLDAWKLLGEEKYANKIIVTTDNPRHEDPQSIIDEVLTGFSSLEKVDVVLDRRQAIDIAITNAQPGDVVLLAGKGHETSQIVGDVHIAFDDRRVAREFLVARENGTLA